VNGRMLDQIDWALHAIDNCMGIECNYRVGIIIPGGVYDVENKRDFIQQWGTNYTYAHR